MLILSDIGPKVTSEIVKKFEEINLHEFKDKDFNHFKTKLKNILINMVPTQKPLLEINPDNLNIIMVVGVNGTGKTSFIGKLAYYFRTRSRKIMVVPADTYRAGAINQLAFLANQARTEVLNTSEGADPASVVFDGIHSAIAKKKEILLIDTAGRLHTYNNLMKELEKIKRVASKTAPKSSIKTILVIDATTGQNGIIQARQFKNSLDINSLALTKLDGTAKGGIALTIQKELNIPVEYITFGEKIEDLTEYETEAFIEALLD